MFQRPCLLVVMLFAIPGMGLSQEAEPKKDERTDAVKAMVAAYVEAFNKKDLEKVSQAWAEDCTVTDRSTGERVEGRAAMKEDLKAGFEAQPDLKLSAEVDRVKFLTDDVAQVEGHTVVAGPNDDPVTSTYSAILTKAGDKWQIKSLEELAAPEPATPYDALKELDFLLGRWVDDGEDSRVETNIRYAPSEAFLIRSFVVHTEEGVDQEGTQVIGWDPRAKQIRSWTFNSDGSFGEAIWTKSGDEWLIKSSQTLADGGAASGTYVLSKESDDSLQLQLIGHTVNGSPQPASDPVTMRRQQEETAAADEATGKVQQAAGTAEEKTPRAQEGAGEAQGKTSAPPEEPKAPANEKPKAPEQKTEAPKPCNPC
jgi:uncharacterized protein (TIGR02246 family)